MNDSIRRGGRPTRSADRTPNPPVSYNLHAWFLQPWDVETICEFLACTDRHLRSLRADPDLAFPTPLSTPKLLWWPADILAWSGIAIEEAIALARLLDDSETAT